MSEFGQKSNTFRQYTEAEFELKKAEAKALYLAGKNPTDIDDILDLTVGRTGIWARNFNWDEERNKVMSSISENRLQTLLKQQEETFSDLKIIRDKAIDAIVSDEVVPTKFSEAANAYLNTIEVERKLKTEALQISFISDVANVLKEKIQDRKLLFEIAEGLKEVFNKYQSHSLSQGDKIINEE